MDINTKEGKIKLAIYLGIGLGVALIGRKLYLKISGRNKILRKLGDKSILTKDNKGNLSGKNTKIQFDPKFPAEQLKKALKGAGTNRTLFKETIEPLSLSDRQKVQNYFDLYLGEGETLFEWIDSEWGLNSQEKEELKNLFK